MSVTRQKGPIDPSPSEKTLCFAKEALKKYYAKLVLILPLDDLLPDLVTAGIITIAAKDALRPSSGKPLSERTQELLDKQISASLKAGYIEKFWNLLEMMIYNQKKCGKDCEKLAKSVVKFLVDNDVAVPDKLLSPKIQANIPPEVLPKLEDSGEAQATSVSPKPTRFPTKVPGEMQVRCPSAG